MPFMPLLKELGRASGVGVTINMALLATDRSPNLGLLRVLERAIKDAKADLRQSDWE